MEHDPTPDDIWTEAVARRYDRSEAAMFAPDVLQPVLDRLITLAEGGPVLELASGTGRIALPLARSGLAVTGIELSPAMIAEMRRKPGGPSLPVIRGCMTTARAPGPFRLVVLACNTISNLLTQEAQIACFRNAARHLTPAGRFVIELWVPELRRLPPGQDIVIWRNDTDYLGYDRYDVPNQQVVSHHLRLDGDDAGAAGPALFRSPHRYIWPAELDLMGRLAGFELEHRWADWTMTPFTETAASHVSVYRLSSPPHDDTTPPA